MGNNCCRKKKMRRKLVLLLVGLDNAGKTKAANGLAGDPLSSPVPTVGFSVINLKYFAYDIKIFDLGGGPSIRGIWPKYFVDAHGIIFVIDASDFSRFNEVRMVLEDMLSNEKISGKPLLLLANKQDQENALDEIDVIEYLCIENLVNSHQCPTLVQSCCATELNSNKLDPGIQKGYEWLLSNIIRNYDTLNARVECDVSKQEQKERENMLEKIQKIKDLQEVEQKKRDEDIIESYSNYSKDLSQEETQHSQMLNAVVVLENTNNSSENSSLSFPPVYHGNYNSSTFSDSALSNRPKSALQIVKHQLQLTNNSRKNGLKLKSNKTAPLNLYQVKLPRSAQERQKTFSNEKRNLKSADDYLFTISNNFLSTLNHMGPSGDNCCKDNYHLNKSFSIKF